MALPPYLSLNPALMLNFALKPAKILALARVPVCRYRSHFCCPKYSKRRQSLLLWEAGLVGEILAQAKQRLLLPLFCLCPGWAPWQQHLFQSLWGGSRTACKARTCPAQQSHNSGLTSLCGQTSAVIPIPLMRTSHFPQAASSLFLSDFSTQLFLKNRLR